MFESDWGFVIDPETHIATCNRCGNVASVLPHTCPIVVDFDLFPESIDDDYIF